MSGGFNPLSVVNPATLLGSALGGPIGAIVMQAIQQVVSTVVQDVIQKAGEQLGLPQSAIDLAQGAFASSVGDYAGAQRNAQEAIGGLSDAIGLSGADAGNFQRDVSNQISKFIEDAAREVTKKSTEGNAENASGSAQGAAAKGGGSVLMRIALAIGQALDAKTDRMADIADELGNMGKVDGDNMSQYQELSAEMSALSQEIKIVSEALNNSLKSIGDASSALARKQ